MRRALAKLSAWSDLARTASPPGPLIRDSLRLQSRPYPVTHRPTGLRFGLEPGCGDWFTFYECCVRQDYFRHAPPPGMGEQVLDIGGNFGAFSVLCGYLVGPAGTVHCYEPSPATFTRLNDHVVRNGVGDQVRCFENAFSDTDGTLMLHLAEKSALSSLYDRVDGRASDGGRTVAVRVTGIGEVLDRIPGEIALAKIDCEGAEYEIFDRLSGPDLARIRAIVVETHRRPGKSRAAILDKLRDHGFRIHDGNPFHAVNPALV